MGKAKTLSTLLHTSCTFKEAFENVFGQNKGIPALVCTRWNSTPRQISAITSLGHQALCNLLEDQVHNELKFSPREWSQLQELVAILQPFLEATNLTQVEKVVTISIVLPSILSLNHHLEDLSKNVRYLNGLVRALKKSLWKRVQGIFVTVHMMESNQDCTELPFSDPVYLLSAILDPGFCMMWAEHDVLKTEDVKEKVKKRAKDCVIYEISQVSAALLQGDNDQNDGAASNTDEEREEGVVEKKVPRLFAGYERKNKSTTNTSVASQFNKYLELCQQFDDRSPNASLNFWLANKNNLSKMFPVALRVLPVPASSSPVERVFSHGGIIMRPHRAKLSDKTLSNLIFLKCNSLYMK
ncbi:zinc finger BED domain-containing 4-like [Paramuricea clavata]|uniref:Zinc finger BED domain-containing 4-like n=1 Tax=Paramuricea clavata TaxID=317549 RepID=A0A7D9HNJ3_PARCT|nr:zinc finger BED domain-containing 4-like [Paramuricea clavata]